MRLEHQKLGNMATTPLELVMTDGSRVTLAEGEWAEIEQDRHGRFVRVVKRGRRLTREVEP